MNLNELVTSLEENSDLSQGDKLQMFVSLVDGKALKQELEKQAAMQKIGLVGESNIHIFVYGILKLGCPHLFIETNQEK
jgi:hypothetical protein